MIDFVSQNTAGGLPWLNGLAGWTVPNHWQDESVVTYLFVYGLPFWITRTVWTTAPVCMHDSYEIP